MATLPTPCSVSRAPKPALDWQPVAERQRQRDLQESKRAASRNAGADHTHTFCSPPNQHHVAEKGWEPGRSRGNCPWTYRRPPPFPRSHVAGWHKPPLVELICRPAHQGSLCWTASRLLVDKIQPKPRWSSLLAVCPVSCWSCWSGVKTQDGSTGGARKKTFANPKWGMGQHGTKDGIVREWPGFRFRVGRVWGT